ncbi:LOW QUALITY PROTEIN: embryonal Fyn-associated substrate [Acipenser ruthenus]|uniref:LOW QUALITY PROTEIN: embryonal Fyn-associated substrate n=1 Tax=Acipenser ruthenus TaxID=7906 RepID=UPI0027417AE5|nr:LOW QUALITY PROTEIN: embryonal Fyn-associated substrate [Acipenser ruthenus]
MSLSTVLAKALFDNAAESPDELAFRKGDILMVLERDMGGVPGWWLCSLHGRQGIVPGNRLRLLQSQNQDSGNGCPGIQGDSLYQTPGSQNQTQQGDNLYQAPSYEEQESVYLTPKQVASQIYQAPTVVSSEYLVPTRGILASDTVYQAPALQSDRVYLAPTRSGLGERSAQLSAFQAARQAVANVYVCPTAKHPPGDIYQAPTDPKLAFRNPAGNSPAFQEKSDLGKSSPDNLYQAPTGIKDLGSESFYLAPTGIHQIPNPRQESQILYQTPKSAAPLPKTGHKTGQTSLENVYLAPTNGVVQNQIVGQEAQNMYKSPKMCHKVLGAPKTEIPTSTQEALGKTVGGGNTVKVPHVLKQHVQHKPPVGQTKVCQKVAPISVRDSPKLLRKGGKDGPQIPAAVPSGNSGEADPAPLTGQEEGEYVEPDDENLRTEEVYDIPPSTRWGSLTAPTPAEDSSSCIYNVPRIINGKQIDLLQEAEQEVYDIPSMFLREETYNIPACHGPFKEDSEPAGQEEEVEEDVYSVPSLAGQPSILNPDQRVREVGGMHSVPGQVPEDCGIYDLPAASVAMEEMDLLTEPDFIRRLSISSNGSGQSKSSTESCLEALSALLQSAQCSASGPAPPPRELASLLAEIVSVSRQHGEFGETLSRLSDFIPSLSRGAAPDALLSLVRKALEDSASLLAGHAHRPRLSSQESLSRRPLPALPVAEVKPMKLKLMRKGSGIQERPLPPPPPPAFPLPPPPPLAFNQPPQPPPPPHEGREETGNEYEGIGNVSVTGSSSTAIPAAGESGGYVKLQGKPEPDPPAMPVENILPVPDPPSATDKVTRSPPALPLSSEDRQLLSFYAEQSQAHLVSLNDAIDSLFTSVQGNQPPRAFVSKGKLVIVTAHKLVFIGDTLSRLLASPEVRSKVTTSGAHLCQALKVVVLATKGAALHYPSVSALQEMVNRVAELSQHAVRFASLLPRMANPS